LSIEEEHMRSLVSASIALAFVAGVHRVQQATRCSGGSDGPRLRGSPESGLL
jgi:hypothetical protein